MSLRERYDALWQDARNYFASGRVETDAHLADLASDRRRGLTVLARPRGPVAERFSAFVQQLAEIAPDQYFYQPGEFHVTVLSLFTATENLAPYMARLPVYQDVLESILPSTEGFTLAFRGITASRSCIMVQGFPQDGRLERLREGLRQALQKQGFARDLDQRYRITTAHSTIMRFRTQPAALSHLIDLLDRYRDYEFGSTTVERLQLTQNDWYMSAARTQVLAEYPLLSK